jgi:pimeloyl-ACP methyl ester carboxylesterase
MLHGHPFVIVGVMPRAFNGTSVDTAPDVRVPLHTFRELGPPESFNDFAPELTTDHHVYGITRRGFGASDFSASQNPVDRLRDDVLAVIGALKLERSVLVGHSIAGAELRSVATSHPDRVAGLIYLEAGYP